jgi:hypothetical protein
MNEKLRDFDPDLYDVVVDSLDKHEIRAGSSERVIIEDWLAQALITESLLSLLRKGLVDISGLKVEQNENGETTFEPEFSRRDCK